MVMVMVRARVRVRVRVRVTVRVRARVTVSVRVGPPHDVAPRYPRRRPCRLTPIVIMIIIIIQ